MTAAEIREALSILGAVAALGVWVGLVGWAVREFWRLRRLP